MYRFSLFRDAATACVLYALFTVLTIISCRRKTRHKPGMGRRIAYRYAIVFAVLLGICWLLGLAVWIPFALITALLLLGEFGSELILIPILYPIQQFVLGFPDREKWFLSPPRSDGTTPDPLQQLVGKHGVTVSPLRPAGSVLVNSQRYPAHSEDESYVAADAKVVVCGVRSGALRVRPHLELSESQPTCMHSD